MYDDSIITAIMEQYNNTGTLYQALKLPEGGYVLKYPMGLAVLYAPFFFAGHIIALCSQYSADGFSAPYQYSVFVGGILYSIAGLIVLAKLLKQYFNDKIVILVLLSIVFGTNYLLHITMYGQNAMSHNHLFLAYSLVILLSVRWHKSHKIRDLIFLALTCGISVLSRPSEFVMLIIPLFWGVFNMTTLKAKLKLLYQYKGQMLLFVVILILCGLPQLLYWKMTTGKFIFYSYGGNAGEGFEFFSPFITQVLFSFRKGWLVFTPLMAFSILGFWFLYKKNREIFVSLFLYFIVNVYIVSSWSCWWYAQSFSQRALIPSYPVMAIAFGGFLFWIFSKGKLVKGIVLTIIGLLILLNIFQSWQFHKGIIHADRMTKAYYCAVFGKTSAKPEYAELLLVNRAFEGMEHFDNEDDYIEKSLYETDVVLSEPQMSSPMFEIPYSEITQQDHAWILVTADVLSDPEFIPEQFRLIIHFSHNGYPYKHTVFSSEMLGIENGNRSKIRVAYLTPEVRKVSDHLSVYFEYTGPSEVRINNMVIKAFEMKQ